MTRANTATSHQNAGIAAWRVKLAADIHSYEDASAFLGPDAAVGSERKLASSMTVVRMYDDTSGRERIAVRLYRTNILVWRDDGMFQADNGGYNTPTTTARLNMVAPRGWHFSHHRGQLVGNFGAPMRAGEWHSAKTKG